MGLRDKEKRTPAERWALALKGMTPSTRATYQREVNSFLKWAKETPDTLINYYVEIMVDPERNMGLSDNVNDYLSELDEKGYGGGKQIATVKALKRFFKTNGYTLTLETKKRVVGEGVRPAKAEEIKRVLGFGIVNPKASALVALSKDSALRVSDIVNIRFKHIKPIMEDPKLNWLCFKLSVTKTQNKKRKALPCFGPDAVTHLRLWLDERGKLGLPSGDEHHVFVNTRDNAEYEVKGRTRKASIVGSPLKAATAGVLIGNICDRAGFPELSSNSMRKFNTTALTMAGMGQDRILVLQGKHQKSSTDTYIDAQAETMLEVFKQFYDYLSIESDAERELETVKEKQEATNGEVEHMKTQMQALTDQLDYMRQTGGGMGKVSPEEARMDAVSASLKKKYPETDPERLRMQAEVRDAEYEDFIKWKAQRDKAQREAEKK